MSTTSRRRAFIEPLESRIAPAGVLTANWKAATLGAPIELFAGDGLSTAGANAGTYLLYVEKGSALVFITDLNNNGEVEFNEITGIAAGDGLRLTSFVDIHGDIATNVVQVSASFSGVATTRLLLTDSDNNRLNDVRQLGDGRVLANSSIEGITMRSLRAADLTDQNGDGAVDDNDIALRKAYTTYSIYGDIIAGRGFGADDAGLVIDTTNESGLAENFGFAVPPMIGAIRVGTAASGQFFSYGASNADNFNGTFVKFTPPQSQAGGDINGVRSPNNARFNLTGLYAGDGGFGAAGGSVRNVTLQGDDAGGYEIIAGNGGRGSVGGVGGSIINFSDLGSQTSNVVIRSGSGGVGSTGGGGNAGGMTLGTFNVYGNVSIDLGSGGNGFSAGGNGAALARGLFDQPSAAAFVPGNAVGTWRNPITLNPADPTKNTYQPSADNIGSTLGIDFDGDGFGDVVFTSKTTSSLVVQFGDGLGGARRVSLPDGSTGPDRLYLAAARNAEALTVGDFNGDGRPDIATASNDPGAQAGVIVFLNRGAEDLNNNGVIDSGEDVNGNGELDFLGFMPGRFSPIAGLDTGDPNTSNGVLPSWLSPAQISSLVSGDFDGDGRIELAAVLTTYNFKVTDGASGITTSLDTPRQNLIYLTPDVERNNATGQDEFTGQFYMDFGTRREVVNGTPQEAAPKLPLFQILGANLGADTNNFTSVVIQSSALTGTSINDVVFVGVRDANNHRFVRVVDYTDRANVGTDATPPVSLGTYVFGRVDTNRDLSGPNTSDRKSLQDYTLRDFTILDFDADGAADLGVLSSSPSLFLVGIKGDGLGAGTPNSGSNGGSLPYPNGPGGAGNNPDDNAGNFFGDRGRDLNVGELMAVRAVDGDGDGVFDDFAMLMANGDWTMVQYRPGVMPTDAPNTATTGVRFLSTVTGTITVGDAGEAFFGDVFVPDLSAPEVMSLMTVDFNPGNFGGNPRVFFDPVSTTSGNFSDFVPLNERGLRLRAGDGGDALVGKGGTGGLIGSGANVTQTIDPISLLPITTLNGSVRINASGFVQLVAGDGGNGFTGGGKGGSISGVVVRLSPNVTLGSVSSAAIAGDGGRAVSGAGGAGGDLTANSLLGGSTFIAGDGGDGRAGGAGGNVVGNGTSDFDTSTGSLSVVAGAGGAGVRSGGNGGGISGFSPSVGFPGSFTNYTLSYVAGDGGTAVAGTGGRGGSIVNSSPRQGDAIQGELLAQAGNGGDGLTGGDGGRISQLVIRPATASKRPGVFSILAGSGGDGLAGNGGAGGGVSNITVPARGSITTDLGSGSITGYTFSRIIAGDGGESASARGGTGGGIADVTGTGANEGSVAMVAGAGGDGLFAGGYGGNILRTELFLPASTSFKALIVAGEGGDARGFVANTNDSAPNQAQNAFGGRIGLGGNGGSITDFTQRGNIGSHFDLVAGNGGGTVNYGSLRDTRSYVGAGGSIQRVKLAGDIGNVDTDVPGTPANENLPIKSYNASGQTMADWVNTNLRAPGPTPLMALGLTDAVGNVGLVAGAAGVNKSVVTDLSRPDVYEPLPAPNSVNGSVIDVEARNLMSAVAGSVDKIARIQVVRNLRILGGIIGSDKGVIGQNDYLDEFGAPLPDGKPVLDGRLVDGAVVTRNVVDVNGVPVTLPGRVYTPS